MFQLPDPTVEGGRSLVFRSRATRLAVALLTVSLLTPSGCGPSPMPVLEDRPEPGASAGGGGPGLASIDAEPVLRVRVARAQSTLSLRPVGEGEWLWIGPARRGRGGGERFAAPVEVTSTGTAFRLASADGRRGTWRVAALAVEAEGALRLGASSDAAYPGRIQLHHAAGAGGIDAVNHVPLETYLPGVLVKELYPDWHPRAFEAQAIAARSYALFERSQRGGGHFDLESTTASQVYGGVSAPPRARRAAEATRGQVLAWGGRVLPAFYSSTTGGRGQDASAVFPRLADLPPLRGRSRGEWGSISPHWRWGPIRRDVGTLARRLAGWGEARGHPIASLERIEGLAVISRGRAGRPVAFRVRGAGGRSFELDAEAFRFACNYGAEGEAGRDLPPLERDQRVRSSDLSFASDGGAVVFTGRGWGHGVGLGQWGAQHLAISGRDARAILGFYYPGAAVVRLY